MAGFLIVEANCVVLFIYMVEKVEPTNLPFRREMFCQYYTKNREFRGNATLSYAQAYHYRLDELPDDDAVYIKNVDEDANSYDVQYKPSTRRKAENVCSSEGSKLLRLPKIQQRNTELLNEMLRDEVVDGELAKVILQDRELSAKNAAIKTYNDIKGRIVRRLEHSGDRDNPVVIEVEKVEAKVDDILEHD